MVFPYRVDLAGIRGGYQVLPRNKTFQRLIISHADRPYFGIKRKSSLRPESPDVLNAVGAVPVASQRIERHAVRVGIIEKCAGPVQRRQDGILHSRKDIFRWCDLIASAPNGQGG